MKIAIVGMLSVLLFNGHALAFDQTHKVWDQILTQYTTKKDHQVLFNYKKLKKNQDELKKYLSSLESLSQSEFSSFSKDQKLAFWINAYNAYTIKLILDHYPVKSIKEIKNGFFSFGPWKKEFIELFSKKISLDHIEHEIIREKFQEPRIHFAVNCASMGCPSLFQEAFTAKELEQQLEKAAQNFLQNKDKNYLKDETLYVSKIFKWYGADFDAKFGSFKNFIIKSLNLPKKDYEIEFTEYDWSLNEVK